MSAVRSILSHCVLRAFLSDRAFLRLGTLTGVVQATLALGKVRFSLALRIVWRSRRRPSHRMVWSNSATLTMPSLTVRALPSEHTCMHRSLLRTRLVSRVPCSAIRPNRMRQYVANRRPESPRALAAAPASSVLCSDRRRVTCDRVGIAAATDHTAQQRVSGSIALVECRGR